MRMSWSWSEVPGKRGTRRGHLCREIKGATRGNDGE